MLQSDDPFSGSLQSGFGARSPGMFEAFHSTLSFEDNLKPYMSYVLDIARSVAAIAVVLLHAKIYALGSSSVTTFDGVLYAITGCGTQAVFWFFVISGYLVGGTVIRDVIRLGKIDFRRYFINRFSRLYVVLIPALALGGVLDYIRNETWGLNSHAGFETVASLTGETLLGNILFLQTLMVPPFGSNWALWSLANEFWYYIVFPASSAADDKKERSQPGHVVWLGRPAPVILEHQKLFRRMALLVVVSWRGRAFHSRSRDKIWLDLLGRRAGSRVRLSLPTRSAGPIRNAPCRRLLCWRAVDDP